MVSKGLAKSRDQANSLLMSGNVFVNEKRIEKSGQYVQKNSKIEIKGKTYPWVSRGGVKLEKAILEFNLNCDLIVALDIGASTGGFTDVLLAKGAKKVYAVDVGYGQLDWKLRQDERVIVREKTNARFLTHEIINDPLDAIVCDASFISLKKVLPSGLGLLKTKGWLAALIKPQFEVGKGLVGKGGVVRDPELHKEVITDIKNWVQNDMKMNLLGVVESPLLGPSGNKEFVVVANK